jgi:hypothetical protein
MVSVDVRDLEPLADDFISQEESGYEQDSWHTTGVHTDSLW